jgi:hypothetical protein
LGKYLGVNKCEIERPGTKVQVLSRTKLRTADSVITLANAKHIPDIIETLGLQSAKPSRVAGKKIVLVDENRKLVDPDRADRFSKAVGASIYLRIDRRDIRFEVTELARHMREPRESATTRTFSVWEGV